MRHRHHFFIDGEWIKPASGETLEVINPATEQSIGSIAMGDRTDVDRAIAAAVAAFPAWAQASRETRVALLENVIARYRERMDEMAETISAEMGAPIHLARKAQVPMGLAHLTTTLDVLREFDFEEDVEDTRVVREPAGVCGLITPWNWPLNQITCKVAPALAAGCTMTLKPSEVAPLNAILFAEALAAADVPAGVFNLVHGDGPTVGAALAAHPDIDMVSFTGSTRAGIEVAQNAAPTVKRVAQELGGKAANILLDDVDLETAVPRDVRLLCSNSGQSCIAPARLLVPQARMEEAAAIAGAVMEKIPVGDPAQPETRMGPVVSARQYERIQQLIQSGIDEGAQLVTGGTGRPEGLTVGYFIKPTVFSGVAPEMTIAQQEIFGPVLSVMGYANEDEAVRIANDTPYGLAGYISSGDPERSRRLARRIRAGSVFLDGGFVDVRAPFGGYKQSGNGRESGRWGLEEFLETKAIAGFNARPA